ncbi:hypothetical protein TTRE_0000187801 [Trichuris trichiura]|uniref:Uncharacterized protein n=1 Tax=Trichuris trichiura TaxID=36087 RepID=A0A077Z1P9_TRITR|nr:hypothetical protein TTRE_0000187801 [Trichuris trichiura]
MILLSRRLGPHEHRLLLELVNLHDRLWSLTDTFKSRLIMSPSVKESLQVNLFSSIEGNKESTLSPFVAFAWVSSRANENNPSVLGVVNESCIRTAILHFPSSLIIADKPAVVNDWPLGRPLRPSACLTFNVPSLKGAVNCGLFHRVGTRSLRRRHL